MKLAYCLGANAYLCKPAASADFKEMFTALLKFKEAFDWKVFAKGQQNMKRKKLACLHNLVAAMTINSRPFHTYASSFSGAAWS